MVAFPPMNDSSSLVFLQQKLHGPQGQDGNASQQTQIHQHRTLGSTVLQVKRNHPVLLGSHWQLKMLWLLASHL